jgi:hypothetical protein
MNMTCIYVWSKRKLKTEVELYVALYFQTLKTHILMFQKNLKKYIPEAANYVYYKQVKYQ